MTNHLLLAEAISALSPNAKFSFGDQGLDGLTWVEGERPTNAAIKAKMTEIDAAALAARNQAEMDLQASDGDAARVVDELIELLIAKGTISKSDLGSATTALLERRKACRNKLERS